MFLCTRVTLWLTNNINVINHNVTQVLCLYSIAPCWLSPKETFFFSIQIIIWNRIFTFQAFHSSYSLVGTLFSSTHVSWPFLSLVFIDQSLFLVLCSTAWLCFVLCYIAFAPSNFMKPLMTSASFLPLQHCPPRSSISLVPPPNQVSCCDSWLGGRSEDKRQLRKAVLVTNPIGFNIFCLISNICVHMYNNRLLSYVSDFKTTS